MSTFIQFLFSSIFSDVQAAVNLPVLIGSGVNTENVEKYLGANALIVGSYFKHGGLWKNDVDFDKVEHFMSRVNALRDPSDNTTR